MLASAAVDSKRAIVRAYVCDLPVHLGNHVIVHGCGHISAIDFPLT